MTRVAVIATGPLATIQDLGRPGYQHLGVPRSGAADRVAMTLANRLVGNAEDTAALESLGGTVLDITGESLGRLLGGLLRLLQGICGFLRRSGHGRRI